MGPIAPRYFAGLLHAQVLVLHKPGISPDQFPAPDPCPSDFVQNDALSLWQSQAATALQAWLAHHAVPMSLPIWFIGISEGGEIVPGLAQRMAQPIHQHRNQNLPPARGVGVGVGVVLLSSSGLDPREVAQWQAQRLGQERAWQELTALVAREDVPDEALAQGRSLRYWRDLWHWRVEAILTDRPWPLLHVWGDADALVPPQAYERFIERARASDPLDPARAALFCSYRFFGADHGLQTPQRDGVQWLWAQLEQHARDAGRGCAPSVQGVFDSR